MAKVAFTKFNKIKSIPAVTHSINGVEIEVEQYLPLDKKLDLIVAVIEQSGNGEEGFFNIVKLETYFAIEMVKAYTNIVFTDKQLEDAAKLYDGLVLNQVWQQVKLNIPEMECQYIWSSILNLAKEITTYNNSALGIIKQISAKGETGDAAANKAIELISEIRQPDTMEFLKSIAASVGIELK